MRALGGMLAPARPPREVARDTTILEVREVLQADVLKVSILQTTVFDQPNEARMTIRLRDEGALPIELAAFHGDRMIGHLSAARLNAPEGWLALLPCSVLCGFDSPGVRIELITELRRLARGLGAQVLVSTGNPALLSECGFSYRNADRIRSPFPSNRTGLCPLTGGALEDTAPVQLAYPKAILEA